MAIDTSGRWWIGSDPHDLAEYLETLNRDDSCPVHEFSLASCACGSTSFTLLADRDEGTAQRTCARCGNAFLIADSSESWPDSTPEAWACVECGSTECNVGVGFSLYEDRQAVHWLYVGVRCAACGVLGCFVDWKVGYTPSLHLLSTA